MTKSIPISSFLILAAALLMSGCAPPPAEVWKQDDPRVFRLIDVPETPSIAEEEWAIRHQAVRLNDRLFVEDGIVFGDTISVAIFNERSLTASVDRIDLLAEHRNVRARLLPPQEGHILLTIGDQHANGNVQWYTAGRIFYLRFARDIGEHVFVEVDPEKEDILPPAPPEIPPGR